MEFLFAQLPSFVWAVFAFCLFVGGILKFGIKPIVQAIDARDARIDEQMTQAEEAATTAQALQAKLDEQLSGAEAKIQEMLAEAKKDGEDLKNKLLEQGRVEVEELRHKTMREIEAARYQAIVALREEVAEVSTTVAEKILTKKLDAGLHQELVADAVADYEKGQGLSMAGGEGWVKSWVAQRSQVSTPRVCWNWLTSARLARLWSTMPALC